MCKEQTDTAYRKSIAKSLSETVSIEFFVGVLNFNFFVVKFLSILNDVPAIAATPSGFSIRLSKLFLNLFLSL